MPSASTRMPPSIGVTVTLSAEILEAASAGHFSSAAAYAGEMLEAAPPDLVSDLSEHGIILAGGGSKIFGMDKLIMDKIGVPVVNIKNPDQVVATGAGTAHYYIKDGRTLEE